MHDLATAAPAELDSAAAFEPVPAIEPALVPGGNRNASIALHVAAIAIAVAFAAPVLYVAWRALTLGGDRGEVLAESLAPAWRTVQLAVLVTTATVSIGVSLAWLLTRTDLPMAPLCRVLAPLPLVFPSFIGAAAFIAGLGPDGILRDVLELVGYHPPRRFRGLGPSVLVLTLFTYPLVYLPVAARLATLPPQLEESSRLLGDRPARTFRRVILPLVRGAIAGGALIVLLYCLSEFGAVQLLGFDTLTRVVYATRLADRATSFTAAAILVVMALAAIVIERRLRGPLDHRTGAGGTARPSSPARTLEGAGDGVRRADPRPGPRRPGDLLGAVGVAGRRQRRRAASGGAAPPARVAGHAGVDDGVARCRRQRRRHRCRRPGGGAGDSPTHAPSRLPSRRRSPPGSPCPASSSPSA